MQVVRASIFTLSHTCLPTFDEGSILNFKVSQVILKKTLTVSSVVAVNSAAESVCTRTRDACTSVVVLKPF